MTPPDQTAADLVAAAPTVQTPANPPAAAPVATVPPGELFPVPPAPAAPAQVGTDFSGETDSLGRQFHPAKFRLKDGKPHRDSLKRFVPVGVGTRKPKTVTPTAPSTASGAASPPPIPVSTLPGPEPAPEPVTLTAAVSVETAIGLVQTVLIMIGQDEGILTDLEKEMVRGPATRILNKYDLTSKMTPELEALAVCCLLIMNRLKKPKTQSWFQSKMLWVRAWWIGRKIERAVPTTATPVS